ncbi:L-aspartate oxidase [Leptodesmis sp.]|uniref:L-aspartate oxidase n=1 Tax=Leptodesmis sp. TaxID=3100501 RepID=UPI0040534E8B
MSSAFSLSQPFDVLVIGAGAAGLYTALCLPPFLQVGLITKEPLSLSASGWAQGGIAAVIDPQDSIDLHVQDTLRAGAGLCDRAAVQFLVEHASSCIKNLVDLGVGFDRHAGQLALTLEAAHSRRRVLHAADTTGRAVVSTLAARVLQRDNIQVIQAFTLDLWLDPSDGHCRGVSLLYENQVFWVEAGAVILATGGGGQVFAQTTNPALSTGDGVAIAYRAGAILRDLEFVQFHPTALTKPGAPHFLISEAVRGEGAHLVDDRGYRFAFDYHPAGELAPRDVVSRAIFNHLQKTSTDPAHAHIWLDLRPIPQTTIQHRFPNIIQVCQQWGIDVFQEPIPVTPAAHYWMGGIATDLCNRTSIAGLYAVGETASTGVHGANRLASNSLLECLVFGAQFGDSTKFNIQNSGVIPNPQSPIPNPCSTVNQKPEISFSPEELARIEKLRQELPRLVWQSAGICRETAQMEGAIAQVEQWREDFARLPISQILQTLVPESSPWLQTAEEGRSLRTWAETRNLLDIALLILKSANFRTESRGGHFRSDYPQTDPGWQVHTLVQQDCRSQTPHLWTATVDQ